MPKICFMSVCEEVDTGKETYMRRFTVDRTDKLIARMNPKNVGKELGFECEPPANRTLNLLIKSQLLCQLS